MVHPALGSPLCGEAELQRAAISQGHFGVTACGALTFEQVWEGLKLGVWCKVCANHTFKESSDIKA